MGFYATDGDFPGFQPGVSAFKKEGGKILRVGAADLGPGDDFCVVWHLFDLFPEGAGGWGPRYEYE